MDAAAPLKYFLDIMHLPFMDYSSSISQYNLHSWNKDENVFELSVTLPLLKDKLIFGKFVDP
jgi:hypothetical protein